MTDLQGTQSLHHPPTFLNSCHPTTLQRIWHLQIKGEPAYSLQAKSSRFWQTHRRSPDASWASFSATAQCLHVQHTKRRQDEILFEYFCRERGKKKEPWLLRVVCVLCEYVCTWLKAVYFGTRVFASLPLVGNMYEHIHALVCECVRAALTTAWFIPSFSAVAVWGPHYVMPMHRGLYVIETGLWKPPAIWSPAASDVCTSIHQFPLIAQNWDSVPWLIYWVHSP